jgi:hypothetical protein
VEATPYVCEHGRWVGVVLTRESKRVIFVFAVDICGHDRSKNAGAQPKVLHQHDLGVLHVAQCGWNRPNLVLDLPKRLAGHRLQ